MGDGGGRWSVGSRLRTGRDEGGGGGRWGWPLDVGQLESYWGRVKWGQAKNVIGARLTKP